MILVTALFVAAAPAIDFDDAISSNLTDLQFRMAVTSANRSELRKINKDFAVGYEAESGLVQWKEPMKLKLSSSVNGERVVYLIVGARQSYYVQRFNLRKTDDLSQDPGRHQTLFDFGLITKSIQKNFLRGNFVRTDSDGYNVFDVFFQFEKDKTRYRIWVHPSRRYIAKRVWYNRKGQLMATFEYSNPVQSNGVWIATQVTVKNAENRVAGVTRYSNVSANSGIPDSVFKL